MRLSKMILSTIVLVSISTISLFSNSELGVKTRVLEQIEKSSSQLKSLEEAIPGAVVVYEHTLTNPTDTLATDLVFTDKVPKHTTLVGASAESWEGCTILYSTDGEVFEKSSELFAYQSDTLRTAHPEEYRYIRWIFEKLEPHSQQKILFKIKID
jgi:uncharacterized repeat protein (TIGR01451 family)